MTDKEKRKFKGGVISIFKRFNILDHTATIGGLRDDILRYIDSLQEEPVSDFEMALTEMIDKAQKCVVEPWAIAAQWKDYLIELAKSEEPVSEELDEAANNTLEGLLDKYDLIETGSCLEMFKLGAKWQKEQDQSTIELAEDHAMLAGMEKMKEEMMEKAIEVTVHVDAGNYPYIPQIELYDYNKDVPLAKDGDKYKIILINDE